MKLKWTDIAGIFVLIFLPIHGRRLWDWLEQLLPSASARPRDDPILEFAYLCVWLVFFLGVLRLILYSRINQEEDDDEDQFPPFMQGPGGPPRYWR